MTKAPRDKIAGRIDERRRLFISDDITGKVYFGRSKNVTMGHRQTHFRVHFDNGRTGYGSYTDPKSVNVMFHVKHSRKRDQRNAEKKRPF